MPLFHFLDVEICIIIIGFSSWNFFRRAETLLPLLFERHHPELLNLVGNAPVNIKLAVITG